MKDYWIHVLRNSTGRHYIGASDDVFRRLVRHNSGASRWARSKRSVGPIWPGESMPSGVAHKPGMLLKRQKGGGGFYRITELERPAGLKEKPA